MARLEAREQTNVLRDAKRLWTAFVILGLALFANQYVTVRKIKELLLTRAPGDPVDELSQKVWGLILDSWQSFITPADLAVAAVIALAAGYVIYAEVTSGAVTTLLHRAEQSALALFACIALASVVITRCYLNPGQVFMGDAETHMLRSWMFAEHFRHLDPPTWSNAWYGGFPLLEHYGPLYFIATALLTITFGDIHLATKLLLWGCHVGSVFAMFFFLRLVTRLKLAALVGALAYALSFHRTYIILYEGDLQLSVLFLIYPLILLLVERFLRGHASPRRTFLLVTLVLAALILNHHGYAFFGLVLLAIYLVARLAVTPGEWWGRFKVLVFFGASQVAALFISAFLLVPFLFDMDEHRGMPNSAFPMLVPNPWAPLLLFKLFRWTVTGDGRPIGYVGLSIGLLALVGVWHAIRHRVPEAIGLAAGAIGALLMVKDHVAYNVKNINFFMLFVSALTAWAVIALQRPQPWIAVVERARQSWGDRWPARITVMLIGLLLLDLGPTTFQSVYREDYEFKQPMYRKLLELDGPYKVIERQVVRIHDSSQSPAAFFDKSKLGTPSAYAATQTPLGFFHEGAGRSFGYNAEMVKHLHRDLNEGRVSDMSVVGLYLMGVKYVIFRDRYQWFSPTLEPSDQFTVRDDVLQLKHATPLLFSTRVIATTDLPGYPSTDIMRQGRYWEPETYDYSGRHFRELVEPLMRTMRIDMTRGVADVLIARDARLHADLGSVDALRADVEGFATDLKRVEVRYRTNMEAFGRLPYTYFPFLHVEIDGTRVDFHRSAMNDILLRLPAGQHTVRVRGIMPPLQRQMLWLSLAALLTVLLLPGRLFGALGIRPLSGGA